MTLETKTTEQLESMIVSARETEQSAKAALLVNDRRVYADDVHAERLKVIETERRQSIDTVLAEVQRRSIEVEAALQPADADPMQQLTTEELTRAAGLDTFLQQDVARISDRGRPGDVVAFIAAARAASRGTDKAAKAVFLRRLPEIRGRLGADRATELAEIERELGVPFVHANDAAVALETQRRALGAIQIDVALDAYLQRTYSRRS
jgi:hypothetical protein